MEPASCGQLMTDLGQMIAVRNVNGSPQLHVVEAQNDTIQAMNANVKMYKNTANYMALVFIWESTDYVLTVPKEEPHFKLVRIEPDCPKDHHFCFKFTNRGNFTFSPLAHYGSLFMSEEVHRVTPQCLSVGNNVITISDDARQCVPLTLEGTDA